MSLQRIHLPVTDKVLLVCLQPHNFTCRIFIIFLLVHCFLSKTTLHSVQSQRQIFAMFVLMIHSNDWYTKSRDVSTDNVIDGGFHLSLCQRQMFKCRVNR